LNAALPEYNKYIARALFIRYEMISAKTEQEGRAHDHEIFK